MKPLPHAVAQEAASLAVVAVAADGGYFTANLYAVKTQGTPCPTAPGTLILSMYRIPLAHLLLHAAQVSDVTILVYHCWVLWYGIARRFAAADFPAMMVPSRPSCMWNS